MPRPGPLRSRSSVLAPPASPHLDGRCPAVPRATMLAAVPWRRRGRIRRLGEARRGSSARMRSPHGGPDDDVGRGGGGVCPAAPFGSQARVDEREVDARFARTQAPTMSGVGGRPRLRPGHDLCRVRRPESRPGSRTRADEGEMRSRSSTGGVTPGWRSDRATSLGRAGPDARGSQPRQGGDGHVGSLMGRLRNETCGRFPLGRTTRLIP